MPLIALWTSAPAAVAGMSIKQIVGSAGDGQLLDKSPCSDELREYLGKIPSADLGRYVEQCLASPFDKSGMVLQDLVNELGRRLEYGVENGRYQGVTGAIGFDGLWTSAEQHAVVVEVKTTDAYRISLDTIARYRAKLAESGKIGASSSVLIVVGRQDTGELEAQVRGSRHAWDVRLISADALVKLVQLKENTEGADTGRKIRSVLTPIEYTRVDGLIDVVFTAAKDVEVAAGVSDDDGTDGTSVQPAAAPAPVAAKGTWQFTDKQLLEVKRDAILWAMGEQTGAPFLRKSPAQAWDASHAKRVACTVSKRYPKTPSAPYWYAYHPPWHEFLQGGDEAHLLLGCMDLPFAFALPLPVLSPLLHALNTTDKEDGEHYWHVKIGQASADQYTLLLPKRGEVLPIDEYRLPLST